MKILKRKYYTLHTFCDSLPWSFINSSRCPIKAYYNNVNNKYSLQENHKPKNENNLHHVHVFYSAIY